MKTIIFACDEEHGIGKDGTIPWNVSEDMKHFKKITNSGKQNALICGMKTYDTMKHINLAERTLFCIGKEGDFSSVREALEEIEGNFDNIYFVGGVEIFKEAEMYADDIYATYINGNYNCDTYYEPDFTMFQHKSSISFKDGYFHYYEKVHPDCVYKKLCSRILLEGIEKDDRTGTGTLSIFGESLSFSLDKLPILTTKKVYTRGVIEELLWFIRGSIDSKELEMKKVYIWKGNTSKEYLESKNLTYEEGETGPIYGFQWRHWNARYFGKNNEYYPEKYKDKGIDQLKQVIHTIKTNPNSRRIILTSWNPAQLDEMVLPPCHMMCQFYVRNNYLDCHMYQRSADVFLGLPFNITSYAILTCMIAQVCNLQPGTLRISLGDAHIYKNHLEQVKQQMKRSHFSLPKLRLNPNITDIDDFKMEDIEIIDYISHDPIKAEMAV